MAFSEQIFVIRTWLVNSRSYRLASTCNSEIQKLCFEMEAQSLSGDIGLVSPEWLQSDDSFSFEAFGDIDELMANLPDFAATPPHPSDVGTTPSHPYTTFGTTPPRPSVFATTDGDELQWLQDKNKNKNTQKNPQIHGWIVSRDGRNTRELQEHYLTRTSTSLTKHSNNFTQSFKKRMDRTTNPTACEWSSLP